MCRFSSIQKLNHTRYKDFIENTLPYPVSNYFFHVIRHWNKV